jgi:CPA1 family monovalent cation:H+ antiporter
MSAVTLVLFFLLAVALSRILVRFSPINLPLPLVQIGMGAILSVIGFKVRLDPDIFFLIFIPPLLFLDGWRIPKDALLRDWRIVLTLALGLVVFTVVGIGFLIGIMIPTIPLAIAFAIAAIISPTDPVAVSAIASGRGIPPRLLHILEGESLFNDASGLVCFNFAVAAALTGEFSATDAGISFIEMAAGGIFTGVVIAWGASVIYRWLTRWIGEEPGTPVLISILIPFAAYLTAERLGLSGVLAAVAAGISVHYAHLIRHSSAVTRMRQSAIWEMLEVALNGIIFVLLGEQLPGILASVPDIARHNGASTPWLLAGYVVAITLALAMLRFFWTWISFQGARLAAYLRGQPWQRPPSATHGLLFASLAGVKGAITLAGILTLPFLLANGKPFPARNLAILIAMGVILLSLITASITLPLIAKKLNVSKDALALTAGREREARNAAAEAAIQRIEGVLEQATKEDTDAEAEAATRIIERYRKRLQKDDGDGDDAERLARLASEERRLRLLALDAERDELYRLRLARKIDDRTHRRLVREIDLTETGLSTEMQETLV